MDRSDIVCRSPRITIALKRSVDANGHRNHKRHNYSRIPESGYCIEICINTEYLIGIKHIKQCITAKATMSKMNQENRELSFGGLTANFESGF